MYVTSLFVDMYLCTYSPIRLFTAKFIRDERSKILLGMKEIPQVRFFKDIIY